MANKDLFKQAIAEAKSVREAAIANAKEALEETLTPHLKDMLAAKLQEMEDKSEEVEEVVNEIEEDEVEEGMDKDKKDETVEEDLTVAPEMAEAEEDEAEDDSEESEDEAEEIEDAGEEAGEEEAVEGDEELGDLTVNQFKDMIRDIIAQEMGGGEEEMGMDMDGGDIEGMGDEAPIEEPADDMEVPGEEEDEIDLDELLAELEASVAEGKGEIDMSSKDGYIAFIDNEDILATYSVEDAEEMARELAMDHHDAGQDQDNFVRSFMAAYKEGGYDTGDQVHEKQGEEDKMEEDVTAKSTANQESAHPEEEGTNINRTVSESEMKEALETIEQLKKDLHETNLLNSKLLYVNKIFKANNLTESQKVNIIAAFDKAETVKEVKLVFETVSENVVANKKETVTESKVKGMASKATGTTASKPEVINEVSDAVRRMQKLAGIIK